MIDSEMYIKKIKGDLLNAWRNGDRVTIPMKDILECNIITLKASAVETPVLEIEIPLLVDDTGFRFSIEREEK